MHTQLIKVLTPLLECRPTDPLGTINSIDEPLDLTVPSHEPLPLSESLQNQISHLKSLYKSKTPLISQKDSENENASDDEDQPQSDADEPEEDVSPISDVSVEQSLLRSFGVGLPPAETFFVSSILTILNKNNTGNFESLRFFGKLLTPTNSIYIAEAIPSQDLLDSLNQDEEEQSDEEAENEDRDEALPPHPLPVTIPSSFSNAEPFGEGVNKFIYYVYINQNWQQLPQFKPIDLINFAKSYPSICYASLSHLRSLIAIISHSTALCPQSMFHGAVDEEAEVEEDEEEVRLDVWNLGEEEENEEFKGVDAKKGEFCHRLPKLLPNGRVKEEEKEEQEEEEAESGDEAERDLIAEAVQNERKVMEDGLIDRLGFSTGKPLPCFRSLSGEWRYQREGNTVFARSFSFPGAFSVMQDKYFVNFYCGYGISSAINSFVSDIPKSYFKVVSLSQELLAMAQEQVEPTLEEEKKVADE
ncbi:hypothetical protein P9112_007997 [Eukaryota sp. TZLM1-RC]